MRATVYIIIVIIVIIIIAIVIMCVFLLGCELMWVISKLLQLIHYVKLLKYSTKLISFYGNSCWFIRHKEDYAFTEMNIK